MDINKQALSENQHKTGNEVSPSNPIASISKLFHAQQDIWK